MNTLSRWAIQASAIGALLSLALLGGCGNGGGDSASAPSGVYESKFGPPGNGIKLTFGDDNTVEIIVSEGGRDETQRTTFVTSGDSIIIDIPESDGADLTLKRSGAALETTMQGMTLRFEQS